MLVNFGIDMFSEWIEQINEHAFIPPFSEKKIANKTSTARHKIIYTRTNLHRLSLSNIDLVRLI